MIVPGAVLQDRYRIIELIGKGGMGSVYKAVHTTINATVAVKLTQNQTNDPQVQKAFEAEARILANLRHPTIPRVSDYFVQGTDLFLVMDFIDGDNLATLMNKQDKPFDYRDVLRWAMILLDTLDFLHTQQPPVFHRDIKPQNLKLDSKGNLYLLDFGLARGAEGTLLKGYTANYAPLEQFQGLSTDARGDIYSLAVTLYHLLTNNVPQGVTTRAAAIIGNQPDPQPPVHNINPQVPEDISEVLDKAMAIRAEDRYGSAAEMRAALQAAISNQVHTMPLSPAPSASPSTPSSVSTRPNQNQPPVSGSSSSSCAPLLIVFAIVLLLIVVIGGGGVWFFLQQQRDTGMTNPVDSTPQQPSPSPTTPALSLSPAALNNTEISNPSPTWYPTATTVRPAANATPISPVGGGVPTMVPFVPPRPISSGQIVFAIEDSNNQDYFSIAVINTDGGGFKTLLDSSGKKHTSPAWSHDGQQIVFSSNRDGPLNLYVMNADGSGVRRLTEENFSDDHPAWSPDGQRIAFSSDRNGARNIYTINADGSNVQQLTSTSSPDQYPVWSPDGKFIAFEEVVSGRGEIFVMNADGTGIRNISQHQNAGDKTPDWSPDSSSIVFSSNRESNDFDIYVAKVDGSGLFRLTTTTGLDTEPSWSADGSGIVFVSRREEGVGLYIMAADGTNQTMIHTGAVSSPDWQP